MLKLFGLGSIFSRFLNKINIRVELMILMNDFKSEPEQLIKQELKAVERVIRSGWYILGNEVKEFESSFANFCDTNHAIGVGNGMDAIEIGLRASGIATGDEVITTPMTAFATVLAILRAGATPVLADIDPNTGLLCRESVKRCITPRTKAVLLVHLYGQIREMKKWHLLCSEAKISLFEDCAQCHGAEDEGKKGGTHGEWGAYSFYPTKNLGTIGDGGALVTNSDEIAAKAKILRNYGQSKRYHHPELGMNSRLDELHAALLLERSVWLKEYTQRRRTIAGIYNKGINNPLIRLLSTPLKMENHVYHLYVFTCKERDRLSAFLKENGIESLIHYPVPIHFQPPCRDIARDPKGLRNTELHAEECLSIPCHPQMKDEDAFHVVEVINAFL